MALALAVAIVLSSAAMGIGALPPPLSPTDETQVPHYFGPYSNWANSPQVLVDAVVTISPAAAVPVQIGNPLIARAFASDAATSVFGTLVGSPLPAGNLSEFKVWNQAGATASAGNVFHAYVLRPTGTPNDYTVVFDSGALTVPALSGGAGPTGEVATFAVGPVAVLTGDIIGWYGQGIPLDTGVGPDVIAYPGPGTAPVLNDPITMGAGSFPIYAEARTYSLAATVTPSAIDPGTGAEGTATVNPKTGGIASVTVTNPGGGYLAPPSVSITTSQPGATLATAVAVISQGVVNAITVNESGFGFTTPVVVLTGGNPTLGFEATAQASGGVDAINLTGGGSGYVNQPIIQFSLPNLPGGVQATGSAIMDANGVVIDVAVENPGSGYTVAPTVTILDGNQVNPTAATATATIGIGQIDIISGGQGYDSPPTVTITDGPGGPDLGATATASVAARGAVTAINVTSPGKGYLTPGIRKFVDTLPGFGDTMANNLNQYIPVAVPDTTTYPGTDYYEIAVVQYREKLHSDLPPTLLRGYVQLSTGVVPGKQVALSNANRTGGETPIVGYTGVDKPHYLGPAIVATKNKPVRIVFRNLLPTGEAGNLFIPVDTTIMGAGMGPGAVMLDANGVPMDMGTNNGTVLDDVRNPYCSRVPKPSECYTENRATLHLHGGITPWISDGTPHQWITPAPWSGAGAATYPKGVSVSNVPDMPDPGAGAQTFFYTNQQGARLMFYHDHSWGITRLNVYAGEAAPYVITDDTEKKLLPASADNPTGLGLIPGAADTIPLVVQDKTFVPANVHATDPTWQYDRWGGTGDLWTPHVYMPAQNPGDSSGMSAFGRWMYGPWFWPPAKDAKYPPIANPYYDPNCDPQVQPFCEPELIPSTPNISVGMEAFNDTPLVNGTVYPKTTVQPRTYRLRVLNAANDRFWNLQWYVADPRTGTLSEVALKPVELAAAQTDPVVFPTPDTAWSPAGPSWIQIGSEGGFLPAPVVIPNQPITWITDPTRFDVGNVDQHSLLLAPAERADVLVDFSRYRGKTLILYNDAPAAFPARVPVYDYYTGGPDLSPVGAPTTLPGYGPNTRTIMKVTVANVLPVAEAFDLPNTANDGLGRLQAAFAHHLDGNGNPAGVFESGQDPIIVGQAAYNSAYYGVGANAATSFRSAAPRDGFARIADMSMTFNSLLAPNGSGQTLTLPFENKGIHDEMNSASFDEWGRMTANMGLEAPGPTPLLQNIILYPFVNPATELLNSTGMPSALNVTPISVATDGTQIWKITHNGVDTHPLHFHLFSVQVLNRVTWDNIIIPPDPNELGWKETVRVSPLEDTIVALRPITPSLPFGVPDSSRPLNPMMPIGARGATNGPTGTQAGFNNTDTAGNPIAPIVNTIVSFGWEYVWHCHILSHEEMDMMRPISVTAPRALPAASVLGVTGPSGGPYVLTWTDPTVVSPAADATWGNPQNEIGYRVERATWGIAAGGRAGSAPVLGPYSVIGTALANATSFTDSSAVAGTRYRYRIVAFNAAGTTSSNLVDYPVPPPNAPTNLTATLLTLTSGRLTWTDNATNETGFVVERQTNGGAFVQIGTLPALLGIGSVSFTDSTLSVGNSYTYRVYAVMGATVSAYSNTASLSLALPAAPSGLTGSAVVLGRADLVTLRWVDNSNNEASFTVQQALNNTFTSGLVTINGIPANSTSYQLSTARLTPYYYRVQAVNAFGTSAWSNIFSITTP